MALVRGRRARECSRDADDLTHAVGAEHEADVSDKVTEDPQ